MTSARVMFQRKEQKVVDGRKFETWVPFHGTWADLPGLSVKEQTDVHNRTLTNAITLEIRTCRQVQEILDDLKKHRVIHNGRPYTLNSSEPSRSHAGWVRILASRTD